MEGVSVIYVVFFTGSQSYTSNIGIFMILYRNKYGEGGMMSPIATIQTIYTDLDQYENSSKHCVLHVMLMTFIQNETCIRYTKSHYYSYHSKSTSIAII